MLGFGAFDLLAQQLRQAAEVAGAFVRLDHRAHRHAVGGIGAENLSVDLDGAGRIPQLLAVDLGGPAQDLHLLRQIRLRNGLPFQQSGHAVPALRLEEEPPLGLARAAVGGGQLLGTLPGREGPLVVAELLLADRGDLLQAGHEILRPHAGHPGPLVRKLQ